MAGWKWSLKGTSDSAGREVLVVAVASAITVSLQRALEATSAERRWIVWAPLA